jgi:hypothetical protein
MHVQSSVLKFRGCRSIVPEVMKEIIFEVHEDEVDGGYTAQALGFDIFTEADTLEELRTMARDAVSCHFDNPAERPPVIRLHFVRDEVLAS